MEIQLLLRAFVGKLSKHSEADIDFFLIDKRLESSGVVILDDLSYPSIRSVSNSRRNSRGRSAFLMPVQRVVGSIQIENDLRRCTALRRHKQIDKKPF